MEDMTQFYRYFMYLISTGKTENNISLKNMNISEVNQNGSETVYIHTKTYKGAIIFYREGGPCVCGGGGDQNFLG